MKILLLGKNGQVGQALERALAPLAGPGELLALDRSNGGDLAQLDATDGRLYIQHTVVAAVVSKVMRRVLRRKQRRRGEGRQRTMIQ